MMKPVKFESELEVTDSKPPWHILRFPKTKVAAFGFKGNLRRVVCTLNGTEAFNCSLFPAKEDYFITLSKKLRDGLGLKIGDLVTVELEKDESKYGMPMPEEFAEVLRQDPDGDKLFHALTGGMQRSLIYMIAAAKNIDKRIHLALITLEHLKDNDGKVNGARLFEEIKRPMF